MDYMRQLNGFWNWRRTNEVSHVQADLYFALLGCANAAYWKEPLSIPNSTLIGMCQISKTELHKQRLVLIQKGLIWYGKGKKGTSGTYVIHPLYETNLETHMETNLETNPAINVETNHGNIYKTNKKTKTNTAPARGKKRDASYDIAELEALIDRPLNEQEAI